MKRSRIYPQGTMHWDRPVEHTWRECGRTLREVKTVSKRTVVTVTGVINVTHAGPQCPDGACPGYQRTSRSAEADALALPGCTSGLDVVLLVGQLHLGTHQTVDESHQNLLARLAPLGVRISRRDILSLFDASSTLLRARSKAKDDWEWLAQAKKNRGIIVSVDGIQPEKGNETVSLVRDTLTGRVLAAEQVTSSDTEGMKALLAPVVALEQEEKVKVLGTMTDAHESELLAVDALWPEGPHQVCPFHALRDASASACEADTRVKTAMRTHLQPKVRAVRTQITKRLPTAFPNKAQQRAVLEDDATGRLMALNTDGLQPFTYATVEASPMVEEIDASLAQLGKKGGP